MKVIQPNLFIPGAAKSGTTSLHALLNLHPDVCMSSTKEPVYLMVFDSGEAMLARQIDIDLSKHAGLISEDFISIDINKLSLTNSRNMHTIVKKLIFMAMASSFWWLL